MQPDQASTPTPSQQPAVFLIHGLGGTQYDLGSMHKQLKNAGFVTYSLTLPGHGTDPKDLAGVVAEDWMEAVTTKYREIITQHETLHVMGMCMGSLLAIELVKREKHTKGRLVSLAAPVFIDGWATPWYTFMRPLLYYVPGVPSRMKIEEEEPYGIKNEQLRAIVKDKFARGENFHYRWVPLACLRQVDRLRGWVMTGLKKIACETLVMHAREDELTSLRSANYLVEHIGGQRARMVILENSYHMICVDNDREQLARTVLEFFGVSSAAQGMAVADAQMSSADLQSLTEQLRSALEAGDFAGLFALGIPDVAWFQPGHNRSTGVFRGRKGLARLQRWSEGIRFAMQGTPVFNAGMALWPGQLVTVTGTGNLTSSGMLALAVRSGKLLEARWFPHDATVEDRHFGGEPEPDGPTPQERAFEAASVAVKTLAKPPSNEDLLSLYALYKQATSGDAGATRPGAMDVVGRAKYDAWLKRKGQSRDVAMADYIALVQSLQSASEKVAS